MPTAAKAQRWVDLIATLLASRFPVPFERLAHGVPAYLSDGSVREGMPSAAVKRMFERDKKELREFGVPIDTVGEEGDPEAAYRLRSTDFYLPYLAMLTPRGPTRPRQTNEYGYRSLANLVFEPDELAAIVDASRRASELGDPTLAANAASAMRKLAFDLPLDPDASSADEHLVLPRATAAPEVLDALADALVRRKRVEFSYQSMSSQSESERMVEPYGLFFLNGSWYLAARETDSGAIKNFRASRISDLRVNPKRAGSADYAIPKSFNLREHGRAREPWELGNGDTTDATVDFTGHSGVAAASAQLGTPVEGHHDRRTFRVTRMDTFSRWLLSFGGDAIPVSPPELVSVFREQIDATRALYTESPSSDTVSR